MRSRQISLYFVGTALVGGVLLAVGQSWAIGSVIGACAGAIALGVSALWNRHRAKDGKGDSAHH